MSTENEVNNCFVFGLYNCFFLFFVTSVLLKSWATKDPTHRL